MTDLPGTLLLYYLKEESTHTGHIKILHIQKLCPHILSATNK